MTAPRKIVLAYSGGLDTSIIVHWLKQRFDGCEVHAYCGDVGQGRAELDGLAAKAAAAGADSCRVDDLRREWLTDYVWPCVRAMAVYEGRYLLGTSMARPILSKGQVAYARELGADAVAHGCTGKGNDQVRFELGYQALAPDLQVLAPWRDWDIKSREDALDYADRHQITVEASRTKIYSRDRNLWHISHEGGDLESPAKAPPDDVWVLTTDPRAAPEQAAEFRLSFEAGVPTALDGDELPPEELLERLNAAGAAHGVGRVDICENRLVGMKSRGVYETPGGTIILEAARTDSATRAASDSVGASAAPPPPTSNPAKSSSAFFFIPASSFFSSRGPCSPPSHASPPRASVQNARASRGRFRFAFGFASVVSPPTGAAVAAVNTRFVASAALALRGPASVSVASSPNTPHASFAASFLSPTRRGGPSSSSSAARNDAIRTLDPGPRAGAHVSTSNGSLSAASAGFAVEGSSNAPKRGVEGSASPAPLRPARTTPPLPRRPANSSTASPPRR